MDKYTSFFNRVANKEIKNQSIAYLFYTKDDWSVIDELDSFLHVYERRLTPKIRTVVDLSIKGHSVEEIAKLMGVSKRMVYEWKRVAKQRFLEGEHIL